MVYVFHAIHNFRDLADSVQRRYVVRRKSGWHWSIKVNYYAGPKFVQEVYFVQLH